MKKLIRTADLRKALDSYNREEISYGRMVEMLNECANKALTIPVVVKSLPTKEDMNNEVGKLLFENKEEVIYSDIFNTPKENGFLTGFRYCYKWLIE